MRRVTVAFLWLWAGAVLALNARLQLFDLGPLTLQAPSTMVLTRGGIDSVAGFLADEKLHLNYDFGLNTDSLQAPSGAIDFQAFAMTLDGLPARFVSYRADDRTGQAQVCAGIHVPQVRASARGRIGLTLHACGPTADSIQQARTIFASVRLRSGEAR